MSLTDLLMQLLVLLALTLLNAIFSGAEIALISVRASRLRELAEAGNAGARAALALRANPERLLATVQVGITVVGAAAGAFGGSVLAQPLATQMRALGAGEWADPVAFALVVSLVSFLSIVFGELVPKSLAMRSAEPIALLISRPLLGLAQLARPLVWFLTATSNVVLRPLHDRTTFVESRMSADELQQLVEEAASAGAVNERAGEIASRALEFGKLRANALMVPRSEIIWMPANATPQTARQILQSQVRSRYPVVGKDEQDVLGYVLAHDLYEQLLAGAFDVKAALRKLPFLPERMAAVEVLRKLQAARSKIGLVVDDYGAIAGLISIDDLGEELVGEMLSEHERPSSSIRPESEDSFVVEGTTPVHEVNRELDLDLPTGPDWSTLAGLVIAKAGEIPQAGSRIALEPNVEAEIVDATNRGVKLLRLRKLTPPSPE